MFSDDVVMNTNSLMDLGMICCEKPKAGWLLCLALQDMTDENEAILSLEETCENLGLSRKKVVKVAAKLSKTTHDWATATITGDELRVFVNPHFARNVRAPKPHRGRPQGAAFREKA